MTRCILTSIVAFAALAVPALGQPAPEPFKTLSRGWRVDDRQYLLTADGETGALHLARIHMLGAEDPLVREGRLTDAERAELRALAAVVAGLPADESGGLEATAYTFELSGDVNRYFVPAAGGQVAQALRPLDAVLDRLTARLEASPEVATLLHLRRARDPRPDVVRDFIEVHGDGTVEAHLRAGLAVRTVRGELEAAEREAIMAALAAVDLDSIPDAPSAAYPRVRVELAMGAIPRQVRLTLSHAATAARLAPLHQALDAVIRRLAANPPSGWARIHRGDRGGPGTIEVEGGRARLRDGAWTPLTPVEVQALDRAMARVDISRLPTGPISGWDLTFELELKNGAGRSLNRTFTPLGTIQEPGLQALDAALDAIVRRLRAPAVTAGLSGSVERPRGN